MIKNVRINGILTFSFILIFMYGTFCKEIALQEFTAKSSQQGL